MAKWIAWAMLAASSTGAVHAQQPFYTDDADVAAAGRVHVELFDEHDWLQPSQTPHRQQNTLNVKVNYGLADRLELNFDAPLITIVNDAAAARRRPVGVGDLNVGVKYNLHQERAGSPFPAFTVTSYLEVPTGEVSTGLGSGLVDVWVYAVVQKTISREFILHLNGGYLFHGNTATGTVGIATARGHVATMGGSLVRKMSDAARLGVDVTAATTRNATLEREQLQVMLGGNYTLRRGFVLGAGVIAGHFTASPRFGVQVGFAWDVAEPACCSP